VNASAPRWIDTVGALGAILVSASLLVSFFTSGDTGDTASELMAYVDDNATDIWWLQITALAAPLLIGLFVVSLWSRLREAREAYRAMTVIGGTLFVAFFSTALTLWAAPLIDDESITTAGAEGYLMYDDAGWVLLGLAGISIAVLIVGATLAAMEQGWVPKWAVWVSILLGVVSLATIVAVGIFAWSIWLIAAGVFLLLEKRPVAVAEPPASPA
jgi:hypothetical protein